MDPSPSLPPSPDEYFVLREGDTLGPYSLADLQAGLLNGQFDRTDFVRMGDESLWHPLHRVVSVEVEADESDAVAERESSTVPEWGAIAESAKLRFREQVRRNPMPLAGALLAIGVLVMAAAQFSMLLWMPWFLVAAWVGFTMLVRGRSGPGIAVMIAALAIPILLGSLASLLRNERGEARVTRAETATPFPELPASDAAPNFLEPLQPVLVPIPPLETESATELGPIHAEK